MANSLFQQMNQSQQLQNSSMSGINPQALQSVKRMAGMLKGKNNPMQMLQMLGGQNPQLNQVMQMMNGSNMSPKQLFMNMVQQQGIDPNQIISMIK